MIDLDEALRAHADQWTRTQAAPLDLDVALAGIPRRHRHIRAQLAVAAAVVAVAAAAVAIPLASRSPQHAPSTRQTRTTPTPLARKLANVALRSAEGCGDPDPTVAQAVRSTRARAVGYLMEDGVSGDEPVWAIQVEGRFSCVTTGPPGHHNVTGAVLTLVVDTEHFELRDSGVTAAPMDLSKLGDVLDLPTTWEPPAELWHEVEQAALPGTTLTAVAVYADWHAADRLLEGTSQPRDDGYVWVVAGTGRFRSISACCPVPSGQTPPAPRTSPGLVLVFHARDGALLDTGPTETIGSGTTATDFDLSSLGTVVTLHG